MFANSCAMWRLVASVMLICALGSGCEEKKAAAPVPNPAQDVSVVEMRPQRIVVSTELAGRVSAFRISEVRPQVSGIVKQRLFTEGADVEAGEVLYQIDPSTYQANLESAQANLMSAEANVAPARLKKERFDGLVKVNAVSRQEHDDANAAYKQAAAAVAVSRAAVKNARIQLDYTSVTAPISGRIGRSAVTPGALVTENQSLALTTIQQLDPVYVDIVQSSAEVLRLKQALESGDLQRADVTHAEVRLKLEDGSDFERTGKLQFTDISVDESTGMVLLRALFSNADHDLLPGMYVRAVLNEGVDERALLLPQGALLRDAKGNAFVYAVNAENRAEARPVKVGRTHGASWIVLEGLAPGDRVIAGGLQKIRAGSTVHILEDKLSASAQAAAVN